MIHISLHHNRIYFGEFYVSEIVLDELGFLKCFYIIILAFIDFSGLYFLFLLAVEVYITHPTASFNIKDVAKREFDYQFSKQELNNPDFAELYQYSEKNTKTQKDVNLKN